MYSATVVSSFIVWELYISVSIGSILLCRCIIASGRLLHTGSLSMKFSHSMLQGRTAQQESKVLHSQNNKASVNRLACWHVTSAWSPTAGHSSSLSEMLQGKTAQQESKVLH